MSSRLWPLYNESELGEIPQPKWLVENHITDGFSVIYGPPKSGKTFVALDWALSMAAGQQWAGYQVEASPVLYVSGEGAGGLHRRITAWKQHRQVRSTRMYVIPFAARIGNPQHIEALQADVHATGARLLVIDTLARSMAGADENSAKDMGEAIHGLDLLRERTGVGILVIHHSGVDGTRPRGSTALFGASDTLIRVEQDMAEPGGLKLSCEGQKDAPPFKPRRLQLTEVGPSMVLTERPRGMTAI
jgi:RecA-family ATPase